MGSVSVSVGQCECVSGHCRECVELGQCECVEWHVSCVVLGIASVSDGQASVSGAVALCRVGEQFECASGQCEWCGVGVRVCGGGRVLVCGVGSALCGLAVRVVWSGAVECVSGPGECC